MVNHCNRKKGPAQKMKLLAFNLKSHHLGADIGFFKGKDEYVRINVKYQNVVHFYASRRFWLYMEILDLLKLKEGGTLSPTPSPTLAGSALSTCCESNDNNWFLNQLIYTMPTSKEFI